MPKRFEQHARFLPRRLRLSLEALEDRWLPSSGLYGQLPLSFVPNQGQAAAAVDFTSSGNGYAVTVSRGQATLALQGTAAGVTTLDMRCTLFVGAGEHRPIAGKGDPRDPPAPAQASDLPARLAIPQPDAFVLTSRSKYPGAGTERDRSHGPHVANQDAGQCTRLDVPKSHTPVFTS